MSMRLIWCVGMLAAIGVTWTVKMWMRTWRRFGMTFGFSARTSWLLEMFGSSRRQIEVRPASCCLRITDAGIRHHGH